MPWNQSNNGKDPWERDKRQSPPDLDAVINKFLSSFGGILGSKNTNNGNSGGGKKGTSIFSLLIIASLIWSATGFYIVSENERAVILRFGEYQRTAMPGPGWHLPRPIETHETVNFTGIRSVEKRTTMLTQDENIVELAFSVQYRIKNAEDYLFNVENPDIEGDRTCRFGSRSTICGVLDSAIRDVVGKNKMDYILREGRTEISNRTEELMQVVLDSYQAGIQVTSVNLQDSQPPDAVQDAFQDATKAREDMERYKNEAQAYANEIVPRARGEAARMIQDALAYKERVIANAEGDADRFLKLLKEYKRAPEVTRKRLYMDSLESVLSNSSKLMIDIKEGNNLMLLPLDKIINSSEVSDEENSDETIEDFSSNESKQNNREGR
jgi:membrane protease subunit HflK